MTDCVGALAPATGGEEEPESDLRLPCWALGSVSLRHLSTGQGGVAVTIAEMEWRPRGRLARSPWSAGGWTCGPGGSSDCLQSAGAAFLQGAGGHQACPAACGQSLGVSADWVRGGLGLEGPGLWDCRALPADERVGKGESLGLSPSRGLCLNRAG